MTSGLCLSTSLGDGVRPERFVRSRAPRSWPTCPHIAFGIIAVELHYPIRMVFGAVFVPSPSSPMWWMGVFYGTYLVVLLVEIWSMFTDHPKIHQWSCTVASVVAICAPATLGAVFGMLSAKPFWSGPFTVIMMVTSAFLAGSALLGIVFSAVVRFEGQDLVRARRSKPSTAAPRSSARVVRCCGRQILVGMTDGSGAARGHRGPGLLPIAAQCWILRVASAWWCRSCS